MGGWYETNDIRREILADLAGKRAYAEIAWLLRYETARYPIRACPVDCRKPVDVLGVVLTQAATGNGQVHPFMVIRNAPYKAGAAGGFVVRNQRGKERIFVHAPNDHRHLLQLLGLSISADESKHLCLCQLEGATVGDCVTPVCAP